jgi:hypothetical protein
VPRPDYHGEVWEYEDGHLLYRGMDVPPPGDGDVWQQMDPFMFRPTVVEVDNEQPYAVVPGRVMEIPPSPEERIASALEKLAKDGLRVVNYNGGDYGT